MDLGSRSEDEEDSGGEMGSPLARKLPPDLPTSLDARRPMNFHLSDETEMYDAWQGQSQFLTTPQPARLGFALDPDDDDDDSADRLAESDSRLESMLAAQAALRQEELLLRDEASIAADKTLTEQQKRDLLSKALNMAASNGDVAKVDRLLQEDLRKYLDVDGKDEEGTSPLVYAACFGHEAVVSKLIDAGANVNEKDGHNWSALMWALTNKHRTIVKLLMENGASSEIKKSQGRTAIDYIAPNHDITDYLNEGGFVGGAAMGDDDFYDRGLSEERFEDQMFENDLKRRMMMESSMNLEVDLSSLGLDEQAESPMMDDIDTQEFVWDKCLPDQMFVFSEEDLPRIIDIVITDMLPSRSPSQKPVPANVLFLCARFCHYLGNQDLLAKLLFESMDKINDVVEEHQWDMTILAFWASNGTLLLHYLRKDAGLVGTTVEFQVQLSELINEIYILIVRDAERRMDKVLDSAMLDHETIPGFEEITFQNEWRIFRSKKKALPEPPMTAKRFRPPSPKQKAKPSPRNIMSLLSSTLFVLDLYDVHSVIATQIVSQLFYWLSAELFNRIMSNRRYLARTKAMQIRMNVSILEDWARTNDRQPGHYEGGSLNSSGETTAAAAKRHFEPVIQLLQWLQCFSSLGDDMDSFTSTMQQLTRLSPEQILHSVKHYRAEVGEKSLPKPFMKYLVKQCIATAERRRRQLASPTTSLFPQNRTENSKPVNGATKPVNGKDSAPPTPVSPVQQEEEPSNDAPENLLMDPALMLPFVLPTSTDMLISYGAGVGGMNRERERKYQPFLPAEFVNKLDAISARDRENGNSGSIGHVGSTPWGNDDDDDDEDDD